MKCPNCNETLLITERQTVEIDYCPSCRGVWLDRGELDKLLEFASNQKTGENHSQTQSNNRSYDNNYDQDRGRDFKDKGSYDQQYPRKKKSFLSDFFDFD